ncbi:hypothetical protein Tco_0521028 [Tanacetum coccineum]
MTGFSAQMDFRSFMVEGIDGEFHFRPKGGFADEGDIVGEAGRLRKSSKATGKRKLATGPSSKDVRNKLRKVPLQASKVAGDASDSLDVERDPDIHGEWLKFNNCNFSLDSRKEFRKRHSGKEKVTLDDLFLLHSMDGGVSVDVPWHVAKFLCDKAKGSKRKSPIVGAHLIRRIASYYGLMTFYELCERTWDLRPYHDVPIVRFRHTKYNGLGIGGKVAEIQRLLDDDDGSQTAEMGDLDPP